MSSVVLPLSIGIIASPPSTRPTDYSGAIWLLYAALAVATFVAFFGVLSATAKIGNSWLRLLLRILPITVLWSFAPMGHAGYWWPTAFCLLMGDAHERIDALESIALSTVVLFGICVVIVRERRR